MCALEAMNMSMAAPQHALAQQSTTHVELGTHTSEALEYCGHTHHIHRSNWLRAAILGANDGLVSTGALLMGLSGGGASQHQLLLSAVAGLVAGGLSMAAGEYVSVAQQVDIEKADVQKERDAQNAGPLTRAAELRELRDIYVERGLNVELATRVAQDMTELDAVRAHARDELGIDVDNHPNAVSAAFASFIAFVLGALGPTLAVLISNSTVRFWATVGIVVLFLFMNGVSAAALGGSSMVKGPLRVVLGGSLALAITFGVGRLFNTSVA